MSLIKLRALDFGAPASKSVRLCPEQRGTESDLLVTLWYPLIMMVTG